MPDIKKIRVGSVDFSVKDATAGKVIAFSEDTLTLKNDANETISGATIPISSKANASTVTAIDNRLSTVESEIMQSPYTTSPANPLVNLNFVNSSIATNTATFRGTSAANLTEAQFLAWANALPVRTNNDYVFWNTVDSDSNIQFKRYKFVADDPLDPSSTGAWTYEYALNNSSFTAAQWDSINSGITSGWMSDIENDIDNKVDKIAYADRQVTENAGLYAVKSDGTPALLSATTSAISQGIVVRDSTGQIYTNAPIGTSCGDVAVNICYLNDRMANVAYTNVSNTFSQLQYFPAGACASEQTALNNFSTTVSPASIMVKDEDASLPAYSNSTTNIAPASININNITNGVLLGSATFDETGITYSGLAGSGSVPYSDLAKSSVTVNTDTTFSDITEILEKNKIPVFVDSSNDRGIYTFAGYVSNGSYYTFTRFTECMVPVDSDGYDYASISSVTDNWTFGHKSLEKTYTLTGNTLRITG